MMSFLKKLLSTRESRKPSFSLQWIDQADPQELINSYARVDRFFDDLIEDPSRYRLSNVPAEDGKENAVLVAYLEGELVGAIWAGPPMAEAQQAQMFGSLQGQAQAMNELALAMLDHTWMLFDVAVAPDHRGKGLAQELLRSVVEKASTRKIDYLWGVATPASIGFYESVGMSVMPAEGALVISHMPSGCKDGKPTGYLLPIMGESRWILSQLQGEVHLGISYVEQSMLEQ
ncbi:GNAT family N-acetyltransferase [Glutamicibacter sp. 363]|uniref:GNAT family N-acetyltransferase n=1 Tax=unclassified Glutamicibacter TaxID=2627139 RepID=UPI0040338D82